MSLPTTCSCGRLRATGVPCVCGKGARPQERLRAAYRRHYDSEYRSNRKLRYEMAGGRCEMCGRPVADGEWECDHLIPVRDWTRAGSPNQVGNLRVLCRVTPSRCHQRKTREDRRKRRVT